MKTDESKKRTRKERERDIHRGEILEAAEKVFAQKGYHAATIEEIARTADFGVGTLYNFFRDKNDLYNALVMSLVGRFWEEMEKRIIPLKDPRKALAAMANLRFDFFNRHSGLARIMIESMLSGEPRPPCAEARNHDLLRNRYLKVVEKIFKDGVKKGVFHNFNSAYMALFFDGMITGITIHAAQHEDFKLRRNMACEYIEKMFITGKDTRRKK